MKNYLKQSFGLVIIAVLAIALPPVFGAWTEPTATPPNNNVPAPINVSIDAQTKSGNAGFGGQTADAAYGLTSSGSTGGLRAWGPDGVHKCDVGRDSNGISCTGSFTGGGFIGDVYGLYGVSTTGVGVFGSNGGGDTQGYLAGNGNGVWGKGTNSGVFGKHEGSLSQGAIGRDMGSFNVGIWGEALGAGDYAGYFGGGEGVYSSKGVKIATTIPLTHKLMIDSGNEDVMNLRGPGTSDSGAAIEFGSDYLPKIKETTNNLLEFNAPVGFEFNDGEVGINMAPTTAAKLSVMADTINAINIQGNGASGSNGRLDFGTDGNPYLWESADDALQISTIAGTYIMGGNVGIGTGVPQSRLTIAGDMRQTLGDTFLQSGQLVVGASTTLGTNKIYVSGGDVFVRTGDVIVSNGSFIDDGQTLIVPDYVFEPGYEMMTLEDVEKFVNEEYHLPNIPSRDEIKADGVDVTAMQMKLLEKIEELTLYTIQQQKEIDALREEIEDLENRR